jgi:flagellar biosynthesis/type III secretory pathway M-ring protein FliF/YscJ
VDPKPAYCGGSGYQPAYTGSSTSTAYDESDAQLKAYIRHLDRKIIIKSVILGIVGFLVLLSLVGSIVFVMRKRRQERELLAADNFKQEQGNPTAPDAEMAIRMQGQEQGVIGAQGRSTTANPPR